MLNDECKKSKTNQLIVFEITQKIKVANFIRPVEESNNALKKKLSLWWILKAKIHRIRNMLNFIFSADKIVEKHIF